MAIASLNENPASLDWGRISGAAFGIEIFGITFADLSDRKVQSWLRDLWIEHGLIVFREAEGPDLQLALSRVFGPVEKHPLVRSRDPEHPFLLNVRYNPDAGDLYEIHGEQRGLHVPWHKDLIYTDQINHGGILRPVELPETDGETGFLDQISLYDSLPTEMKVAIEGLSVLYKPDFLVENAKHIDNGDLIRLRHAPGILLAQEQGRNAPRSIHPLVFTQAETGRKVLNFSPWFADAIVGMEEEPGHALLEVLSEHCRKAQGVYYHSWLHNDMVLWDNWRTVHCVRSIPAASKRWMQRTTITGDYGHGRSETDDGSQLKRSGFSV